MPFQYAPLPPTMVCIVYLITHASYHSYAPKFLCAPIFMTCRVSIAKKRIFKKNKPPFKLDWKPNTLLEILSYATTMFATRMQLPVACNYLWFFMQLQWIFAPFLGVYATMVQLWSPSSQPLDDFYDISSYIFDMHILIVACATKICQLWSFGKLGTHFL